MTRPLMYSLNEDDFSPDVAFAMSIGWDLILIIEPGESANWKLEAIDTDGNLICSIARAITYGRLIELIPTVVPLLERSLPTYTTEKSSG